MSDDAEMYPGDAATATQVLRLAEAYRKAAETLLECERRQDPLSLAPCRLSAIQSIELHLSALLLHVGHEPCRIRKLQHDLSVRTELAIVSGIQFRKKTAAHLSTMTKNREYLITRYGPEILGANSQMNRLTATLNEVARKVAAAMKVAPTREISPCAQTSKLAARETSIT